MHDQQRYWFALNKVKGIGPVRFKALIETFGDPKTVWNAGESQLRAASLGAPVVESLLEVRKSLDFERVAEELDKHQVKLFTWEDEAYPRRLKDINRSPPLL